MNPEPRTRVTGKKVKLLREHRKINFYVESHTVYWGHLVSLNTGTAVFNPGYLRESLVELFKQTRSSLRYLASTEARTKTPQVILMGN